MATQIREYLLEVKSPNADPSCSPYNGDEAGYHLYAERDTWLLPFCKRKVKINIEGILFPDRSIGIVTGVEHNSDLFDVDFRASANSSGFIWVTVRSKKPYPIKIEQFQEVALLAVIPSLECLVVHY